MDGFVTPEPHKTVHAYHKQVVFFSISRSGNWVVKYPGRWKQARPIVEKASKRIAGFGILCKKGPLFQRKETYVWYDTFGTGAEDFFFVFVQPASLQNQAHEWFCMFCAHADPYLNH